MCNGYMHMPEHMYVQGQLYGISFFFPHFCGSGDKTQITRLLQQGLLPTEPSHWPYCYASYTMVLTVLVMIFIFDWFSSQLIAFDSKDCVQKDKVVCASSFKEFYEEIKSNNGTCTLQSLSSNLHRAGLLFSFYQYENQTHIIQLTNVAAGTLVHDFRLYIDLKFCLIRRRTEVDQQNPPQTNSILLVSEQEYQTQEN